MPSCASHSSSEPHSSPESIKYKQQGYFNGNALLHCLCNVNTFLLEKLGSSVVLHLLPNESSMHNIFMGWKDKVQVLQLVNKSPKSLL